MIKMESTCNALKCDVFFHGELVGEMEGVSLIQWFIRNKYKYTGAFSRFKIKNQESDPTGMIVDIFFKGSRLILKDAHINFIKDKNKNGTFVVKKIEYQEDIQEY